MEKIFLEGNRIINTAKQTNVMSAFMKAGGTSSGLNETEKNNLFHSGCIYLLGGSVGAAYDCFRQIVPHTVSSLFNRALCCYEAQFDTEAFRLLTEAEQALTNELGMEKRNGNDALTELLYVAEYTRDNHRAPMPPVPVNGRYARIQILRLKADVAYRLKMYEEVRKIAAGLNGHYAQINDILSDINSTTP